MMGVSILQAESIPVLADVVKEYIIYDDLDALCAVFEVEPPRDGLLVNYIALARMLVFEPEKGNNLRLLRSLLSTTKTRCMDRVAQTTFERREYHQEQLERITEIENEISQSGAPTEIAVAESHPFIAKSELRQTMATAGAGVLVVDNYVGPGTLDCLVDVRYPVRILTGAHREAIGPGFDRALVDFQGEGRVVEVRQHPRLHDRHIAFGGRCWLLGSSIKDAGRKAFNMIEVNDSKSAVLADIEEKWTEGTPYKP
jgi:hypothetical protein